MVMGGIRYLLSLYWNEATEDAYFLCHLVDMYILLMEKEIRKRSDRAL